MTDQPIRTNQDIIENFVCGECGGKLSLINISGESEQAYCARCMKTHTGTLPEVYQLAREYCDTFIFPSSASLTTKFPELQDRLEISNIGHIIRWLRPRLAKLDLTGGGQ